MGGGERIEEGKGRKGRVRNVAFHHLLLSNLTTEIHMCSNATTAIHTIYIASSVVVQAVQHHIVLLSVGIDLKELGGSDVEMFEILPRD